MRQEKDLHTRNKIHTILIYTQNCNLNLVVTICEIYTLKRKEEIYAHAKL